uniref:Potassium channel domain-containing protein n=1 Tax=Panagrolaimus sp. JU765 TaxID=591449 RepID=A0AC34QAN3_9BILA
MLRKTESQIGRDCSRCPSKKPIFASSKKRPFFFELHQVLKSGVVGSCSFFSNHVNRCQLFSDQKSTKMLTRIRRIVLIEDETARKIRRLLPLLLLAGLVAYLFFGTFVFWFLEHDEAERDYNHFYFHLATNRRRVAREISQKIFNDTKNLFVVIDLEQSNRVQTQLADSLKDYERQLQISRPVKDEWDLERSFGYSFGYSLSLLTTLGHSTRAPRTTSGELFALLYSLVGIPFFILTLVVVAHRIFSIFKKKTTLWKRHFYQFLAIVGVYLLFLFVFAYFIYATEIQKSFWSAIYTTMLSAMTIHTKNFAGISETDKVLTLLAVGISLFIGVTALFWLFLIYDTRETAKITAFTDTTPGVDAKVQVIVNETGDKQENHALIDAHRL